MVLPTMIGSASCPYMLLPVPYNPSEVSTSVCLPPAAMSVAGWRRFSLMGAKVTAPHTSYLSNVPSCPRKFDPKA